MTGSLASPLGVAADLCRGLRPPWSHRVAAGSIPSPTEHHTKGPLFPCSEHLSLAGWAAPPSPLCWQPCLAPAYPGLYKGRCVPAKPAWP